MTDGQGQDWAVEMADSFITMWDVEMGNPAARGLAKFLRQAHARGVEEAAKAADIMFPTQGNFGDGQRSARKVILLAIRALKEGGQA